MICIYLTLGLREAITQRAYSVFDFMSGELLDVTANGLWSSGARRQAFPSQQNNENPGINDNNASENVIASGARFSP